MRRPRIKDRPGNRPLPGRILHGSQEPIFEALPERVLANFRSAASENALVWNRIYPLAQPTVNLRSLLRVRPLWGTLIEADDELRPYFWGYDVQGERLPGLDEVLRQIDGEGQQTEVDLFLLGSKTLILVEAKHLSALGRCWRYAYGRCPEIHAEGEVVESACRYWETPQATFYPMLDFGDRPQPGDSSPLCDRHYQLARTTLVGGALGERLGASFHLWMILPKKRWRSFERRWLDFTERIADHGLWRRMRVLAWERIGEGISDAPARD